MQRRVIQPYLDGRPSHNSGGPSGLHHLIPRTQGSALPARCWHRFDVTALMSRQSWIGGPAALTPSAVGLITIGRRLREGGKSALRRSMRGEKSNLIVFAVTAGAIRL